MTFTPGRAGHSLRATYPNCRAHALACASGASPAIVERTLQRAHCCTRFNPSALNRTPTQNASAPACRVLHNQIVRVLVLAAVVALLAVQPDVRAARQNPPAPGVDAAPSFDQWLENLIREAHERGYSDTLVDQ